MSSKLNSNVSKVIVAGFVSIIILSFLFTTDQFSGSVSGDSVANVDGRDVKINEYQRALEQQINFYSQIYGGKRLTSKQIKQFQIKEFVIENLVNQKLLLNLADIMNIDVPQDKIKSEIRTQEYFLRDGKFDVELYRNLLRANSYTPSSYETIMKEQVQAQNLTETFQLLTPSKSFVEDKTMFRLDTITANAIVLEKDQFIEHVKIEKAKIKEFMNDEKNDGVLKAVYESRISNYKTDAQVKASHILIKIDDKTSEAKAKEQIINIQKTLTTANFSKLANQHTQDPSGKGKGGSLGWFKKGVMDKNFENTAFTTKKGSISAPVRSSFGYHLIFVQDVKEEKTTSFEEVKEEITKFHLQKMDSKGRDELIAQTKEELVTLLSKSDYKKIDKLKEKFNFQFAKDTKINQMDKKVGNFNFKEEIVVNLFKDTKFNEATIEDDASTLKILFPVSRITKEELNKELAKNLETNLGQSNNQYSTQVRTEMIEFLKKNSNITTNPKLL